MHTSYIIIIIILCRMVQLLKPDREKQYVDLTVSLQDGNEEDIACPPVRYYFQ